MAWGAEVVIFEPSISEEISSSDGKGQACDLDREVRGIKKRVMGRGAKGRRGEVGKGRGRGGKGRSFGEPSKHYCTNIII